MGYQLKAFIGKAPDLTKIAKEYKTAYLTALYGEISLIPMTADLYDEMNQSKLSDDIGNLQLLSAHIEKEVLALLSGSKIAYFEADYFGGNGCQEGIIWENGRRKQYFDQGDEVINAILAEFGINGVDNKDAFTVTGLDRHRETEDWLP